MKLKFRVEEKGGPGSGHRGHSGRPGKRGGSAPGSGGGSSGSYTFNSPRLGKVTVPKSDVEAAKKLGRVAVANQDAPNLEAYFPVARDNGVLYALTGITPDDTWRRANDPKLAYDEDYMWLADAQANVYVGHLGK